MIKSLTTKGKLANLEQLSLVHCHFGEFVYKKGIKKDNKIKDYEQDIPKIKNLKMIDLSKNGNLLFKTNE